MIYAATIVVVLLTAFSVVSFFEVGKPLNIGYAIRKKKGKKIADDELYYMQSGITGWFWSVGGIAFIIYMVRKESLWFATMVGGFGLGILVMLVMSIMINKRIKKQN